MHLRFWHDLRGAEESWLWNPSRLHPSTTENKKKGKAIQDWPAVGEQRKN